MPGDVAIYAILSGPASRQPCASSLRHRMLDCPGCRLRRDGAFIDTRLFPLNMACLRHGYWLYRDGAGRRLDPTVLPEITKAQRRMARIAARHGTDAAVRAYLARYYLREQWKPAGGNPFWYSALVERWYQRSEAVASQSAHQTSWLPWWAVHSECVALAAIFASRHWAERAVPAPDLRHRLFYQHMLTVLGIDEDWTWRTVSIRSFGSLPDDIREQAGWGRLLSDPEWGSPIPSREGLRKIPFIDITDDYARSVA